MIKRFLTSIALTLFFAAPAHAKVDPGTWQLLRTVDKYVDVQLDPDVCDPSFYGYWDSRNKELVICTHGAWDAEDHDTVRHEVWHIIQLCHTPGLKYLQPVMNNDRLFELMVRSQVTPYEEQEIIRLYPPAQRNAELEAYVMAHQMTAKEIERKFLSACIE